MSSGESNSNSNSNNNSNNNSDNNTDSQSNKGGHVDTIGKQLADIKGKGAATLKRVTEASEERIVMRRADTGARLFSGFVGVGLFGGNLHALSKHKACLPDNPGDSQQTKAEAPLDLSGVLSEVADDDVSLTTTTSDVNSEDDAASIASRLSQIVVEQEEKLLSSSGFQQQQKQQQQQQRPNQMFIIDNSDSESTSGRRPGSSQSGFTYSPSGGHVDELLKSGGRQMAGIGDIDPSVVVVPPAGHSIAKNNQLKPNVNKVRSLRSNNLVDQQLRDKKSKLAGAKTRHSSQDYGTASNKVLLDMKSRRCSSAAGHYEDHSELEEGAISAPSGSTVPKIQVITDEDQNKQEPAKKLANRASESVGKDGQMSRAQSMADLTLGSLPERGDLRSLETGRANKQRQIGSDYKKLTARERSNTFGSMEKLGLNAETKADELVLNIRRSAWTLSEFDQTFNKSGDKSVGLIDSAPDGGASCLPANVSASQATSGQVENSKQALADNLLVRVFQRQQNSTVTDSFATNVCSPTDFSNRQHRSSTGQRLSVDFGANQFNPERRPSANHSIISIPTSIESYCSNLYGFSQNSLAHRRKKSHKRKAKKNNKKNGAQDEGDESAHLSNASQQGPSKQECNKCPCLPSCCNLANLGQYVPIVAWLPAYKLSFVWGDLMAGLAVAVLNISTSLSAAVVAETDFSVAFRASIVNTFVYSLLCSSRHTSFGSWSIMSQMLSVSVRRALSDELILARIHMGPSAGWQSDEYEKWHLDIIVMYTFLIGLVQFVCGLLNLGKILASFIPEALCSSLITATAFTMAIGQLSNMCGTSNKILWSIEKNTTELWADLKNPPVDITDLFAGLFRWVQQIALLVKYHEQINLTAVIISIISVTLLTLNQYVIQKHLERYFKRKIFIPSELILLILMIIVSSLLNLRENYQVTTCGPLNIDFVVPDWPNFRLIRELWFDSFATALISFTMVYVMAKTYSNKFNYEVDCNQELIACGAGNLIGGLCDALPATASFSRTAGQVEAGGQTQMASIVNCVGLFIMARVLGHHVAELPVCVMAATLFYGFVRMMARFPEVFVYWRVCKVDFAIWMVTFISILTLDIVNGFVYGFIFSILTMLYRAQTRRCYMLGTIGSSDVYVPLVKYPLAQEIDGIKIFQFCGPIHYVCADLFERLLRNKTRVDVKRILRDIAERQLDKFNPRDLNLPTHIILDFSMISYIDSAGIHAIKKIIEDFQRINITILLASLASHVAAVVKREPSLWIVYKQRFYVTLTDAVHCAMHDGRLLARGEQSIKILDGRD